MTFNAHPDPAPVPPDQRAADNVSLTEGRLRVAFVAIAFAVLTILFGRVVWIGLGRGRKAVHRKGS